MNRRLDRRAFLRRLGGVGLAVPVLPTLGCRDAGRASPPPPAQTATPAAGLVTRPVLLAGPGDAIHLRATVGELPMAYVSRARQEVFVDYAFREQSRWMLDAHISVSTGVWRIPLPGDPARRPIQPGDKMREFEELDIAEWDPALEPAEGDFRLVRGRPRPVTVTFQCVPMAGSGGWFSGGPWDIRRCDGLGTEVCREDFAEVGTGRRHPIRGCVEEAVSARFLTWLCRE